MSYRVQSAPCDTVIQDKQILLNKKNTQYNIFHSYYWNN